MKKPISTKLKNLMDEFVELSTTAREKSNEANRKQTEVKNEIKADWQKNEAPHGSYYILNGYKITFEAGESEMINPEDLYKELEDGNITKEQFLRCIKVGITDTGKVLGGDVVEALKQTIPGAKASVSFTKLPVEEAQSEGLFVADKPKIKRRAFKRKTDIQTVEKKEPVKRKLMIRRK